MPRRIGRLDGTPAAASLGVGFTYFEEVNLVYNSYTYVSAIGTPMTRRAVVSRVIRVQRRCRPNPTHPIGRFGAFWIDF